MVGREIRFLDVCPLYPDELAMARAGGSKPLLEAFAARGIDPGVVDLVRPSVAH